MTFLAEIRRKWSTPLGYSIVEVTIVISIIGILAGIAIAQYSDLLTPSKEIAARERAEWLNSKVKAYVQIYGPLGNAGVDATRVIQALQNGPPGAARKAGLPFVPLNYQPIISGNSSEYRIQWNGSNFKPLNAGEGGTGIVFPTDSPDMISG
jgi:prepilin-type N-terminal cleavage/methylation domain-containing protein